MPSLKTWMVRIFLFAIAEVNFGSLLNCKGQSINVIIKLNVARVRSEHQYLVGSWSCRRKNSG
jgi:hypothetical protein